MGPMLLLTKGKPTKALCAQCRRLFAIEQRILEANRTNRHPAFMCPKCWRDLDAQYKRQAAI